MSFSLILEAYFWNCTTDHKECNPVPKWISMKTRVQKEIGMTESWELPVFWELNQPQPSARTLSTAVYVGNPFFLSLSWTEFVPNSQLVKKNGPNYGPSLS